ncbi:MAG: DUF971 domain-containing protein [Candidatus Acidoferrales bacterium]
MAEDPRAEPTKVKILLTSGEGVKIDWRDAHHSHYTFPYLREHCPCATCNDRRARHQSVTGARLQSDLPLYQERVRAVQAEPVGHYAVRFDFSDAHTTGIYSFDYLRRICPCPECRTNRKEESQ